MKLSRSKRGQRFRWRLKAVPGWQARWALQWAFGQFHWHGGWYEEYGMRTDPQFERGVLRKRCG